MSPRRPTRNETPGAARNRQRRAEGKAPLGRPPWPKGLPKEPVEADDVPEDGDAS